MRNLLSPALALLLTAGVCADPESMEAGRESPPPAPPSSSTSTSSTTSSTTTSTSSTTSTTAPSTSSPSTISDLADSPACWSSPLTPSEGPVTLDDVTASLGLIGPLVGMRSHAAAWGDVNRDGWADLFVGTFADGPKQVYRKRGASGPSSDRLLLGGPDGFTIDESFPEQRGRTSGALFADLDADDEQELVIASNAGDEENPGTRILDRRSDGWRQVRLPVQMGARAIGVLDVDGDGLLDLFVTEDRWSGGSSRLLRNTGGLDFVDVTKKFGLPLDIHGLGVSTVDLDGDRRADIFVSGSNRLFVMEGGSFQEVSSPVFEWEFHGDEDDVAGVAVADLNRDRLPDLVIGQHFNSTVQGRERVAVRLYLNRGIQDGKLRFEDVTGPAGLVALPTKAPHVEIVDLDNDGWPDIVTSASAGDGSRPAFFMHEGLEDGIPRFLAPTGLGSDQYWVTGGAADVDRDGRQDLFLAEWDPGLPSLMLRNSTPGGHWLSIAAGTAEVGTVIDVYEDGHALQSDALIGSREVVLSTGYAAGIQPVVHFGLGSRASVDVVVTPPANEPSVLPHTQANRHIDLAGCAG